MRNKIRPLATCLTLLLYGCNMIYTSWPERCGRRRLWTWCVCDPESGGVDHRLTLAAAVHLSGFMVHDAVFHHKVIHHECNRTRGLFGGNRGLNGGADLLETLFRARYNTVAREAA